MLYCICI
ncbi:putative hemoglobin and hemoglobin-haptoglobin-binding protein 3 precursor, partial [Haemophilus influenzae]